MVTIACPKAPQLTLVVVVLTILGLWSGSVIEDVSVAPQVVASPTSAATPVPAPVGAAAASSTAKAQLLAAVTLRLRRLHSSASKNATVATHPSAQPRIMAPVGPAASAARTQRPTSSPVTRPPTPIATTLPFTAAATRKGEPSSPHPVTCPVRHPADHGLVNTQRPALVLYTVTSVADRQARQVEIDNFRFFKEHAMFPPNEPTALFSSVDFAIMTVNLNRPAVSGQHGVLECGGGGAANVRVFEAPSGPCDLCAEARLVGALGGAEHVARSYEFVAVLNSGVRGPFFTEAAAAPGGKSPVTWIDHFALGGERVYTGAVMTASDGAADGKRPFLFSFSFNFPASLLPALYPVLLAGCSEKPLPALWYELTLAYELDLHDPATDTITAPQVRALIKPALDDPASITSLPKGIRSSEAKLFDEKVAQGVSHRLDLTRILDKNMAGTGRRYAANDRKFRCVFRSEMQLLRSALEAKLPLEEGAPVPTTPTSTNGTAPPVSTLRRPKLSPAQAALLSPALSGYLHEGHFFLHTWKQNQTMVNMGHASVALYRTLEELKKSAHDVSPCSIIMPKHGGGAWRAKAVPHSTIDEVQALSLAHVPRYHRPSTATITDALKCRNAKPVKHT